MKNFCFLILLVLEKYYNLVQYSLDMPAEVETLSRENEEQVSKICSEAEVLEPRTGWFQYWFPYLRWVPSSPQELRDAEESVLKYVKSPSEGFYVNVGKINDVECYVWTRKFKSKNGKNPTPWL